MSGVVWNLHLSVSAERDYRDILGWTLEHFGRMQVQSYADTLTCALKSLIAGPSITGVKQRVELGVVFIHCTSLGVGAKVVIL